MALDTRWKNPQGPAEQLMYLWAQDLIKELRKRSLWYTETLQFPADQVPSTDPNALDDYEEGTWTPVLTFATPGNLVVAYATQLGLYTKIGRAVAAQFSITTSTFTHTTASGNCQITGLPFTVVGAINTRGTMSWQGITKANYTQVNCRALSATSMLDLIASGSAQTSINVAAADMPSAGTVSLSATVIYPA